MPPLKKKGKTDEEGFLKNSPSVKRAELLLMTEKSSVDLLSYNRKSKLDDKKESY